MHTSSLTIAILAGQLICVSEPANAQKLVSFSGETMATRYTITIPERPNLAEIQQKIDARLKEINDHMSTYDKESELSRFNESRETTWFPISHDTAEVVAFSLEVSKSTEGAFDPTVGSAVNLWGFGPAGRRKSPPTEEEIDRARRQIGYQHIFARLDPPAILNDRAGVYLDLSAVAKGYAVDEISNLLTQAGCESSLVVLGGEIRAKGTKPDGSLWRIGIETPDFRRSAQDRTVQIKDCAVGTSGDWRNAFIHDGVRYSHVIDPKTARPVHHALASVTVFADKAIQTDAWATALLVMGDDKGIEWCEKNQVAAMFFVRRDDGTIISRGTTHLVKRITP